MYKAWSLWQCLPTHAYLLCAYHAINFSKILLGNLSKKRISIPYVKYCTIENVWSTLREKEGTGVLGKIKVSFDMWK